MRRGHHGLPSAPFAGLLTVAAVLENLTGKITRLRLLLGCPLETCDKTEPFHPPGELSLLTPAGINDDHPDRAAGMLIDESREQGGMIGFVEEVAADDQIKKTHRGHGLGPITALKMQGRQFVQSIIFLQELIS